MKSHNMRALATLSAAAALLFASVGGGFAASPLKLDFVAHAAFFSAETKQPKALDPQVFIRDTAAQAATGPQGIKHVDGLRPPLIDQDAKSSMLYNAEDKPLGFDLQTWLSASGSLTITEQGGKTVLEANFKGLRPNAHYSLFENHFDHTPVSFTPIDGTGNTNSFVAQPDGSAKVSITLPDFPTHANAVLLVYHSDGQTHGLERGRIGIDAHHQLIARPENDKRRGGMVEQSKVCGRGVCVRARLRFKRPTAMIHTASHRRVRSACVCFAAIGRKAGHSAASSGNLSRRWSELTGAKSMR